MEACRLRALFRNVASFSSQQSQRLRTFSSSPSAGASSRVRSFYSDDTEDGSSVYRHALKFQRPSTIKWQPQLFNSVSFIGTIDRPLKKINPGYSRFGVHTLLNVEASRDSYRTFRILLMMWDEMAEICIKHLKLNDFIFVSGHLGSYTKADVNGKLKTNYKVIVKEINYVAQYGEGPTCQKSEQLESGEGEAGFKKYKDRLHLWQVFFTNPYEWRDCRRNKVNPKHPDFKLWDTGEALWLNPDDPPWIKRQLELYDSRLAVGGLKERPSSRSHVSPLVYDE